MLVSISEPEHFIKTIELLNKMEIGGALVYSTYSETDRGLFVSHIFDQVNYDEQELTVTFVNTKGHEEGYNISEFTIPIEKMEGENGYISIEDDVEEDYYCLNICVPDGNIDVVWKMHRCHKVTQ